MNTDNFIIENDDLELAQQICNFITDDNTRNRAVSNALAASIATKYYDDVNLIVDSASGLHNVGQILENYDISDLYVNNAYVDVRVFLSEEDICVPLSHFENNLLPVVYMFLKINSDLSGAEVLGFITPENVDKTNLVDGYYYINVDSLMSYYDVEHLFNTYSDNDVQEVQDSELFSLLDKLLEEHNSIFSKLIGNKDARVKLIKMTKAEDMFRFVSVSESVDNSFEFEPQEDLLEVEDENDDRVEINTSNDDNSEELRFVEQLDDEDILEAIAESDNVQELEYQSEQVELDSDVHDSINGFTTTVTSSGEGLSEEYDSIQQDSGQSNNIPGEQIDTLFNANLDGDISNEESDIRFSGKSKSSFSVVFLLIVLLIGGGYWGFKSFAPQLTDNGLANNSLNKLDENLKQKPIKTSKNVVKQKEDAMPVESVEATLQIDQNEDSNLGISSTIPAIEQNLDASILVSNLKIDWEVPSGYATNVSAKRYLIKLGKIIQLNLKTELLLLNKPPITNKIEVELKFNPNTRKFETIGIITSSGEKGVDDIIKQTIDKVLAMNISVNSDSFAKIQGNPVLIIRL